MRLNEDDASFIRIVAGMTGMKPEEVTKRFADLDLNDALEVVDAVSDSNAAKVRTLLPKGTDENGEIQYSVGEEVMVDEDEGIVKEPDGPGETIGVLINGELKMVDKNDVSPLKENAFIKTPPCLRALMDIAQGVDFEQAPEIAAETSPIEVEEISQPQDEEHCPLRAVNDALTALEQNIKGLTVAEYGSVHKRLQRLQSMIYESTAGRKRKHS